MNKRSEAFKYAEKSLEKLSAALLKLSESNKKTARTLSKTAELIRSNDNA